jgi:hypothetical protein
MTRSEGPSWAGLAVRVRPDSNSVNVNERWAEVADCPERFSFQFVCILVLRFPY